MTVQPKFVVERVQTGVRMEKRLLKVLKALAEYHDLTLGDLLEGIVLHAFDGKCPFQGEGLRRIGRADRSSGARAVAEGKDRPLQTWPGIGLVRRIHHGKMMLGGRRRVKPSA